MDCSMTTAGSCAVGSSGLAKHKVAGGRITVTFGSPPDCSQVPVHSVAVSGPHPAVRGRKLSPVPLHCGPVVVVPAPPEPPVVGLVQVPLTQSPLAQSEPTLHGDPFGAFCTTVVQMPFTQEPLKH